MQRILLVDDSPLAREALSLLLRYEGYDVLAASNGLEAADTLRHRSIDLLLLDVIMPKMNGIQLLESLRGEDAYTDLQVIILTGSMDSSHLSRVRELGVRHIMDKGRFTMDQLLSRVKSCLRAESIAE